MFLVLGGLDNRGVVMFFKKLMNMVFYKKDVAGNIHDCGLDTTSNTLVLEKRKHTRKDVLSLGNSTRIDNLLHYNTNNKINFYSFMYIRDMIDYCVRSGYMGKPLIHMDYESNPGVWILSDSDSDLKYIIYSDVHRKNAYKGTAIEIIGSTDEILVYGKLYAYGTQLLSANNDQTEFAHK